MKEHRNGGIPVVTADRRPIGIATKRPERQNGAARRFNDAAW
jgi:hypothetical protein